MPIETKVLVLNEFRAALPWLEHGFGTRQSVSETVTSAAIRQIHSNLVLSVDQPGVAGDADALVTRKRGLALSVRTADCYPILIADPVTRSIAAIHAGWRGTAERIVQRTIVHMHLAFGTDAADLHAAIGPGIGVCCYEVGAEVALRFGAEGRARIDLAEANRRQLVESGVPAAQIHSIGRCTRCEPELFHSYRRDGGQAGRMTSFIRIAA
jgi:YfiH family protein